MNSSIFLDDNNQGAQSIPLADTAKKHVQKHKQHPKPKKQRAPRKSPRHALMGRKNLNLKAAVWTIICSSGWSLQDSWRWCCCCCRCRICCRRGLERSAADCCSCWIGCWKGCCWSGRQVTCCGTSPSAIASPASSPSALSSLPPSSPLSSSSGACISPILPSPRHPLGSC